MSHPLHALGKDHHRRTRTRLDSMPEIRAYDATSDLGHVQRIWRDIGWTDSEHEDVALDKFLASGNAEVALVDGEAEAMAIWSRGSFSYDGELLPAALVTGVTTSRIARRKGLAGALTGRTLAQAAEDGCALALLGVFDQGYYDKFGFGSGSYDHFIRFDPATLKVRVDYPTPRRITSADWADIADAMTNRLRSHGSVMIDNEHYLEADLGFRSESKGFGFYTDGRLTHFVLGTGGGDKTFQIHWIAFQNGDQFLQLLSVLADQGDQVLSVRLAEPSGIQIIDLLDRPHRQRSRSLGTDHETGNLGSMWWQARILNLDAVIGAYVWRGAPFSFNLSLTDPMRPTSGWNGIGGEYSVTVGSPSSVLAGLAEDQPLLTATVNAFSRLWLGVRPASGLAVTDNLSGSPQLLAALDRVLRLPTPHPGMDF